MDVGMSSARVPRWTVGDRLRKCREVTGIGVEEMATKIGRTRNSVTRYERSTTVDVNVVRSYSAITDTPMEWLLTGYGPEDGGDIAPVTIGQLRNIWRDNDEVFALKLAA